MDNAQGFGVSHALGLSNFLFLADTNEPLQPKFGHCDAQIGFVSERVLNTTEPHHNLNSAYARVHVTSRLVSFSAFSSAENETDESICSCKLSSVEAGNCNNSFYDG